MSDLKGHTNIVSYEDHMVIQHEGEIGWDILIRMELLTPLPRWSESHLMKEEDMLRMGCDICNAHSSNIHSFPRTNLPVLTVVLMLSSVSYQNHRYIIFSAP